ncbi:MAG: hypothetical protein ACRBN8_36630 [Nannocystales bacterium]
MRSFSSVGPLWASLCLAGLAVFGCQRIGDGESDDDNGNTPVDTDIDDDGLSGGSLLESGTFDDTADDDDGGSEVNCDPVTSAECGDDEKCTVVLQGAEPSFTCVGEAGSLAIGADCTVSLSDGLDGCAAGSVCLGEDAGTCRPLCANSSDCSSALCLDDPLYGVPHCAPDCSPFEPTCSNLLQCRRQNDRFSCVDALPGDVGGAGEPCTLQGDAGCGQGQMCVTGALVPDCTTAGCCTPLCDLDSSVGCDAPATCTPALESAAPGFESIGACFVPA